MADLEPITRDEMLWSGEDVEPITRREMYIRHLYDETQVIPKRPITREEMFILKAGEELHDVTIEQLNVSSNGTYSESGKAYSPVIVEVPQPTITKLTATENKTYTAPSGTAYNEVDVDVPLPENAYLLKDIEGTPLDIATFTDGAPLPMPKLEIAIEPIQEGSGDPSPTNVRPISGHSSEVVSVCGKNKFDLDAVTSFIKNGVVSTQGLINQDGVITNSKSYGGDGIFPFNHPMTFSSNTITVSADIKLSGNHSSNNVFIQMYNSNGSKIIDNGEVTMSSKDTWEHKTITLQLSLLTNVNLVIEARGTNNSVQIKNVQVEVGSSATDFEPYNGQTYTIDLDGTRYGGKLDVVSGVLTITHEIKKVNTLNWYYLQNTFYSSSVGISAVGSPDINSDFVCSFAKSVNKEWNQLSNNECTLRKNLYSQGYYSLCVKNTEYSDATDFKNSLDSTSEITFPLATPIEIQLTPTQVNSLEGVNNISANSGKIINGQYFSKGGITI